MPERRASAARVDAFLQRGNVVAAARGNAKPRYINQKVLAFAYYLLGDILQRSNQSRERFCNSALHAMYPPPLTCSDWPVM